MPGGAFRPSSGPYRLNRSTPLANGLRGWWPMGTHGGMVVPNYAGPNLQGRRENASTIKQTFVPGVGAALFFDKGVYIDQNNFHVVFDDPATLVLAAGTVSAGFWFYSDFPGAGAGADGGANYELMDFDGNGGWRVRAVNTGAALTFDWIDRGGTNILSAVGTLPFAALGHVMFTGGPGGLKLYLNGKLDTSNATPFGATGSYSTGGIGESFIVSASPFYGSIADVALWDRQLSDDEVATLYAPQTRWSLYEMPRRLYWDVPVAAAVVPYLPFRTRLGARPVRML